MPTIAPRAAAFRRRRCATSSSGRVAKANSVVDVGMFDFSVREVLNKTALRRMAAPRPLKIVIENIPTGNSRN
jgi:hypothetical protein